MSTEEKIAFLEQSARVMKRQLETISVLMSEIIDELKTKKRPDAA